MIRTGKPKARRLPSNCYGGIKNTLQTKERRAMRWLHILIMIQFCIFIVALVGLCYEIFKGKTKIAANYCE